MFIQVIGVDYIARFNRFHGYLVRRDEEYHFYYSTELREVLRQKEASFSGLSSYLQIALFSFLAFVNRGFVMDDALVEYLLQYVIQARGT